MITPDKRVQWLDCVSCSRNTKHSTLHYEDNSIFEEDYEREATESWSIVRCEGCGSTSFLATVERDGYEDGEEVTFIDKVLYPRRVFGRPPLKDTRYVPVEIQRMYYQTREALCNDMNVLAGIGIRALVEVVCKQRNAPGGNLQQRIDGLVQTGDLTSAGAAILHSLRTMGNDAAHEVKAHSSEDLATAFEVVEHLLTGIYILPAKAANLPKK